MNIDNITLYTNFQKIGKVNFCYISNFIENFHPKNINENIKFWLKIDIHDVKKMFFVFSNVQKKLDEIHLWQICSLCKTYLAYEYFSGPICTYMIPNITALQHTPSSSIHMGGNLF